MNEDNIDAFEQAWSMIREMTKSLEALTQIVGSLNAKILILESQVSELQLCRSKQQGLVHTESDS